MAVAYLLPLLLLLLSAQLVRCVQFNTQFMAAEGPPGEEHLPNSVSDKGVGLAVELELSEITIRVVVGNKKSLESRPGERLMGNLLIICKQGDHQPVPQPLTPPIHQHTSTSRQELTTPTSYSILLYSIRPPTNIQRKYI